MTFFLAHEDHKLERENQTGIGSVWTYAWNPKVDIESYELDLEDEDVTLLVPRDTMIRKDKHGNIIWSGEHAPTVLLP